METETDMNAERLEDEVFALEQFFCCLQIEDMEISAEDGHLMAMDEWGNSWVDEEIYDFALNECLSFDAGGKLIDGFIVNQDYLQPVLDYAARRGVEIRAVGGKPIL